MAKPSVLVVEDNPISRATASALFETLGFTVFDTYDGHHALSLLEAHPEIGLLFIDVRMPGMSGPELAKGAAAASRYQASAHLGLRWTGGRAARLALRAQAVASGPGRKLSLLCLIDACPRRQAELAKRARIQAHSVESAESSVGESFVPGQDMQAMRAVLEAAGVELTNGDEPGGKLTATKARKGTKA